MYSAWDSIQSQTKYDSRTFSYAPIKLRYTTFISIDLDFYDNLMDMPKRCDHFIFFVNFSLNPSQLNSQP